MFFVTSPSGFVGSFREKDGKLDWFLTSLLNDAFE